MLDLMSELASVSDRATSSGSSGFSSLSKACPCGSVPLARAIHDLMMAELSRDGSSDDRSRQSWTAALASWMFSRTPRSLWNRRQRPVSNNSVRYSSRCSARAHQRAEISRLRGASTCCVMVHPTREKNERGRNETNHSDAADKSCGKPPRSLAASLVEFRIQSKAVEMRGSANYPQPRRAPQHGRWCGNTGKPRNERPVRGDSRTGQTIWRLGWMGA